eukprot:3827186-Prymnesium_polylepis.1
MWQTPRHASPRASCHSPMRPPLTLLCRQSFKRAAPSWLPVSSRHSTPLVARPPLGMTREQRPRAAPVSLVGHAGSLPRRG